jgi:hypothetical protein
MQALHVRFSHRNRYQPPRVRALLDFWVSGFRV